MGYDVTYSASLTVPTNIDDSFIDRNPMMFEAFDASGERGARRVARLFAELLYCDEYETTDDESSREVVASFSGAMTLRSPEKALAIAAARGVTGEIEFVGENDALWKWVLADGELREYTGYVAYVETPRVLTGAELAVA